MYKPGPHIPFKDLQPGKLYFAAHDLQTPMKMVHRSEFTEEVTFDAPGEGHLTYEGWEVEFFEAVEKPAEPKRWRRWVNLYGGFAGDAFTNHATAANCMVTGCLATICIEWDESGNVRIVPEGEQ